MNARAQHVVLPTALMHTSPGNPTSTRRPRNADITVNHPLSSGGANVYLVGHGYAPHFRVTDASGQVFDQVTPFLPNDSNFDSQGVVKLPMRSRSS